MKSIKIIYSCISFYNILYKFATKNLFFNLTLIMFMLTSLFMNISIIIIKNQ